MSDVKKLPVWAQNRIASLEARIGQLTDQLEVAQGDFKTSKISYRDSRGEIFLPQDSPIYVRTGPDLMDWISFYIDPSFPKSVKVNSALQLRIQPMSGNSAILENVR